jgi:hypothetical protein
MGRAAVLQPKIHPVPALRKPWFKNKIICDEGWSVAFSGSSWRVDRSDYYEEGKHLILGGEGAAGQMDIFLNRTLAWGDPPNVAMDEETQGKSTSQYLLRSSGLASTWDSFFSMNLSPLPSKNGSSIASKVNFGNSPVWAGRSE